MAFTKSTVATNNISNLANKPLESAPTLKQKFDQYGIDDKARFNSLIDELEATTGTSGAENIGSKTIVGVSGNTPHAQITDVKAQLDARNAENVKLTGNQTVAGIKTFTSSPVVPVASADTQAPQKKYVDDENLKDVHLTGDQTIAGVKAFLSSPVVPTPTTATQASNKSYVDAVANNFQLGAVMPDSILNSQLGADNKVGSNALLETVNKTDSVSAINEVNSIVNTASFKNKIINGNFDIWQRGTSFTTTGATAYIADRFIVNTIGSTLATTRESFVLGQTDIPNNPKYFNRSVVTSVSGIGNRATVQYRIEGVNTLSGQTITFSFYAKADSFKNMAVEFTQTFGTGGSPSPAVTGVGVTTFALTTSWQKFTVTVAIPSISGKTLGTNLDDNTAFIFWFDAGSTFNSRTNSLGQQSGTFDIAMCQYEQGSVATEFEQRPPLVELALCQRYYEKSFQLNKAPAQNTADSTGALTATGQVLNTRFGAYCNFKVTKRITPVITTYSPNATSSNWTTNGTTPTASVVSPSQTGFYVAGTGSINAGFDYNIHWTADAEL